MYATISCRIITDSYHISTGVADFPIIRVPITFSPPGIIHVPVNITIKVEADQIFVLLLELISAIPRDRIVPKRADGMVSLGRIFDDEC